MFYHLQFPRLRSAAVVTLVAGFIFLSGCGVDYERNAAELADRVYERIGESDFEGAADLYSDRFYERVSRNRWLDTLRQVEDNLGRYESHSLIQARDHTFGPEDDPGEVFTVLMYRVDYGEGEAIEQLTFSRETMPVALVNHQVMSERVAVNFDDSDRPVQVASRSASGIDAEPVDEDPEPAPEVPEEAVDEDPIELVREDEDRSPEPASPSMEERISAELRSLTAGARDPETERFVGQLAIHGINPTRNRILIETRLVEAGERVGRDRSVALESVEPRRIVFTDENGAVYEKGFLTSEP